MNPQDQTLRSFLLSELACEELPSIDHANLAIRDFKVDPIKFEQVIVRLKYEVPLDAISTLVAKYFKNCGYKIIVPGQSAENSHVFVAEGPATISVTIARCGDQNDEIMVMTA